VLPGLTNEQIQKLLSLIEPTRSGYLKLSGNDVWIFDTGASRHMTGNVNCLKDIVNVKLIPMELPVGVFRMAKVQGRLDLSLDIRLRSVLYIPNFQHNLVSIA